MAFKMITLSEKEVGRIAGNAGAHAELMASDLTTRWRSRIPEDQEVIDILQVQMCVRHDLHGMRQKIAQIEREHLGWLETESLSREVRDGTIPQLRGKLVGIQSLFEGNYGAGTSRKVFGPMVTTIPLDPFPLRRVANTAHDRLMAPGFVLPASQLSGVTIVPQDLARSFEPPLATLDQVLVELEDTLPISNRTLEAKIRQLARLRREAGIAARFLEALYYLAGHEEIASRVRLSSHRSRRLESPQEGGDDTGASAAESGGEAQGAPDGGEPAGTGASTDEGPSNEEDQAAETA